MDSRCRGNDGWSDRHGVVDGFIPAFAGTHRFCGRSLRVSSSAEHQGGDRRPALAAEHLCVGHRDLGAFIEDVSLEIAAGEVLALVGESGCGKSLTALALMRLLPRGFEVTGGAVRLGDDVMLAKSERELNAIRGRRVAMLFQQPQSMLDPTSTAGAQVAEPLRLHLGMSRRHAGRRVVELLREVGIPEPAYRARNYAFQLSGGMAQRVMIAAALGGNPEVLIADEPTTALDVTIQLQILKLIDRERRERGLAVLLITHDLSVVAALANRVAVMYAGRIVEQGASAEILHRPKHPYTQVLVESSLLREGSARRSDPWRESAEDALHATRGCRYYARCPAATRKPVESRCRSREPGLEAHPDGHAVRCWAVAPHDGREP